MRSGAVAPLPCSSPVLQSLSPLPPFFPPLESPPLIFPTHQPITVPYVSARSDLIGCVGVVWEVRAVFISHCVLLDSLQQHPECSHRQQKEKIHKRGRRGRKGETIRRERENSSVRSLQCERISCLRNCKCVMLSWFKNSH